MAAPLSVTHGPQGDSNALVARINYRRPSGSRWLPWLLVAVAVALALLWPSNTTYAGAGIMFGLALSVLVVRYALVPVELEMKRVGDTMRIEHRFNGRVRRSQEVLLRPDSSFKVSARDRFLGLDVGLGDTVSYAARPVRIPISFRWRAADLCDHLNRMSRESGPATSD